MKNTILKGSLILVIAGIIAKVLGAIYRVPLSNILGAEGIGVYQMIFPIFSLFLIISSSGVCVTVSHYVAKIRATNLGNEKQVFFYGLMFSLISSFCFAIILFLFSKNIAIMQGNVNANYGYKISAIALIFASLLAPFRGLYQGQQKMHPTAISQILEQIFKVVFGLIFAVIFCAYGIAFGVCGAFLGIALAELISLFFLIFLTKKYKNNVFLIKNNYFNKKYFLKSNLIITLSSIILPLITALDSFVVVNILQKNFSNIYATTLYGLQSGIITSLINFPVVMAVAISLVLLPNISGDMAKNNTENAKKKLANVVEILFIILIPFVLIFVFFAKEILIILYPTLDENLLIIGSKLCQISAINVLGISFLTVFVSVMQSLEKNVVCVFVMLVCAITKIATLFVLASNPEINIFGLAISNVLFYSLSTFFLLFFVKKQLPFSLNQKNIIVNLCSAFFLAICFFGINVYVEEILAKIFVAGICGIIFYVVPLFLFNVGNIKQFFFHKKIGGEINE